MAERPYVPAPVRQTGFLDARKVGERKLIFGRIAFHQARR